MGYEFDKIEFVFPDKCCRCLELADRDYEITNGPRDRSWSRWSCIFGEPKSYTAIIPICRSCESTIRGLRGIIQLIPFLTGIAVPLLFIKAVPWFFVLFCALFGYASGYWIAHFFVNPGRIRCRKKGDDIVFLNREYDREFREINEPVL